MYSHEEVTVISGIAHDDGYVDGALAVVNMADCPPEVRDAALALLKVYTDTRRPG